MEQHRSRLGSTGPEMIEHEAHESDIELGLSVRLDRPFYEIKEHLVAEFERAYLTRCLEQSEMNLSMASRASGISRKHLRTLMSKYGLRRPTGGLAIVSDDDDSLDDGPITAIGTAELPAIMDK